MNFAIVFRLFLDMVIFRVIGDYAVCVAADSYDKTEKTKDKKTTDLLLDRTLVRSIPL
jgi:hypothetical protein